VTFVTLLRLFWNFPIAKVGSQMWRSFQKQPLERHECHGALGICQTVRPPVPTGFKVLADCSFTPICLMILPP
jgi:hypothetical protein